MNVFLHPDLWVEYFDSRTELNQSKPQQLLNQLVVNENNNFLYSYNWEKVFNEVFEHENSNMYDFEDLFSNALIKLNDADRLMNEVTPIEAQSIEDVLSTVDESTQVHLSFVKKINTDYPNVAVYEEVEKLNNHWISFSLASECSKDGKRVRPTEFETNEEISIFFKNLLNQKWMSGSRIFVRTDYLHFGSPFERIRDKKITVCTRSYKPNRMRKSREDKLVEKNIVKTALNDSASIRYSSNRGELHQRTILCDNLIIKQDHDYEEVNTENNNWFITFFYCEWEFEEHIETINTSYS